MTGRYDVTGTPMLQVALDPFTAAFLATKLGPEWWARQRQGLAVRPELAAALRRDEAKLVEARRQWVARYTDPARVPTVGTSEVPTEGDRAGWGHGADGMSVGEAAEVLGVSDVLVRRWCRHGRLDAVQVHARRWSVSRASVESESMLRRSA